MHGSDADAQRWDIDEACPANFGIPDVGALSRYPEVNDE